jgi:hypothetical protein
MSFAAVNYLPVFIAAVAGWLVGAVYYMGLGTPWMRAQGNDPEACRAEMAAKRSTPAFWLPFVVAFIGNLVMAWALAGVLFHLGGAVTVRRAVIAAALLWLGFIATTVTVNNAFSGRKPMLSVIDAGHWLAVLIGMGLVLGLMGVSR